MTAFDYIALNLHILIGKFCRRRIIGINTAYFSRREYNRIRLLFLKKLPDRRLACQIQFFMCPADHILIAFGLQVSDNGASDQSSVSCDINLICFLHN